MRLTLALGSACGLLAFWSGLFAGRSRLAARVEPYLNGLYGHSAKLAPPPWFVRPVLTGLVGLLPAGGPSLRRRLSEAGSGSSEEAFRHQQVLWMLIGAGAGGILAGRMVADRAATGELALVPVIVMLGALAGYGASDRSLSRKVARRRERVAADLPLALDLLTLSLMAGESVQAAFTRVAGAVPGDVGGALEMCLGDVRSGAPLAEALEALPLHLPGPPVARLADSLCTGIERGAPLADTLRAQCDDLRDARRRELLEAGGKREILMLVPVVFLILPVVVAFALYPGLVALDLLVP